MTIVTAPADEAPLPPLDLLYSAYVLSYLAPDAFDRLWSAARERLRPGGFVVVNLFGDRHAWAGEPDTTFLPGPRWSAARRAGGRGARRARGGRPSFRGPTHWHVFDIVARRPA